MLLSSLSKESDCVYVDLLTYNDLEQMKARKSGLSTSNSTAGLTATSTTSVNTRNATKRYLILTYSGEFDRVHYPLPLNQEDSPNVTTLQRIIKKLRNQLKETTKLSHISTSLSPSTEEAEK